MRRSHVSLGLLALSVWGCGYTLVGRASNLPADVEAISIRTFENRTGRVGVEQILTRAVSDELVTRQRYQVVGDDAGAQARLSGEVIGFDVSPLTFDAEGRATDYQITITAKVELRHLGRDEPIWANDRYIFREVYPIEDEADLFFEQETGALEEAAEKFAESMVTDLLEGF